MTKEKHYCDNINCNHNDTKGLCCLFNSDNCKYRQLQKENAELKTQIEKMKWHDLRKDPNDLPNGHKVVLNQAGMTTQYDPNRGVLGFGGAGIIAWCEIPLFKEIKEK